MLLAFDTATAAVTVALYDGLDLVARSSGVGALRHGELLAPAIADVLGAADAAPGDLTRVAVGVGPGPFTGLRVGLVTARTMAMALDVPVVGVCSLDVVAAGVSAGSPFGVATDARRKEVYWARYDAAGRRITDPTVVRPATLTSAGPVAGPVAGHGAVLYPEAFPQAVSPEYPDAADLGRIVAEGTAEILPPEPLYLRRPDIAEPSRRKLVL
jgi:tRNA threonylcarbamoyladenosine biosynthesis protein TsaB